MPVDEQETSTKVAKVTAMGVLFTLSFLFGTLPIKLSSVFHWDADAKNNKFVKMLLGLGGGVLMCTTFNHLLPDVAESFEKLNIVSNIHYAELLMCVGFFTMYFVEECVHLFLHRKEKANMKLLKSLSVRRGDECVATNEKELEHAHPQDHSHVIIDYSPDDTALASLRGLLVVLALSVHELFEGLAVGLEKSTNTVWYMFGAVSAHKLVIAFCIGVELVASGMRTNLVMAYVFTFAVVSPLGIGIGILVINFDQTSTMIVSVILQGLASGTLLYVVFFEILQADKKSGLRQFFSVAVGFTIMFGITMLD